MNLQNQRRIASQLLKCGLNRVWIDPNRSEDVSDAITRGDIRVLIDSGAIASNQKIGVSRGRAKYEQSQRKKGRQTGHGSRRGRKGARKPQKEVWMQAIRPIRKRLKELRDSKKIDTRTYRDYYMKAKGGQFKSRPHMESHMRAEGVLKE